MIRVSAAATIKIMAASSHAIQYSNVRNIVTFIIRSKTKETVSWTMILTVHYTISLAMMNTLYLALIQNNHLN